MSNGEGLGIRKGLFGRFEASAVVVPLAMPTVGLEGQVGELAVGNLGAGRVVALIPFGMYLEPGIGRRSGDEFHDSAIGRERSATPILCDETE